MVGNYIPKSNSSSSSAKTVIKASNHPTTAAAQPTTQDLATALRPTSPNVDSITDTSATTSLHQQVGAPTFLFSDLSLALIFSDDLFFEFVLVRLSLLLFGLSCFLLSWLFWSSKFQITPLLFGFDYQVSVFRVTIAQFRWLLFCSVLFSKWGFCYSRIGLSFSIFLSCWL